MKNCNKTFPNVSRDNVAEKASKSDNILSKVIKEFGTFFGDFLSKNFNSCLKTGSFPVVPIYMENGKMDKSNYRPIRLLSNVSKVYERCMQEQLDEYLSNVLSKYHCGFRQGYGTQNFLLAMIEKLRKIKDKKGIILQS